MSNGRTGKVFLLSESRSQSGDASSSHPEKRRRRGNSSSARSLSPSLPFEEQSVCDLGQTWGNRVERETTLGTDTEVCAPESRTLSELFLCAKALDERYGIDGTKDEPPRGADPRSWVTRSRWWSWVGTTWLITEPAGYPAASHYHVCPQCKSGFGCFEPCADRRKPWDRQSPCGECQTAAVNRKRELLCQSE